MSKILANQIANYGDNSPVEVKEGVNIPAGKPLQVAGVAGISGQVLTATPTSIEWKTPFDGSYLSLTNTPTIPAAQVNADWNASGGSVAAILNKPVIPAQPSIVLTAAGSSTLAYNQSNGEFTFTPPDLSGYAANTNVSNWDTAYSWGDHALGGYATVANAANWDVAYSWGDHGTVGYLTAEADTLQTVLSRGATTSVKIVADGGVRADILGVGGGTGNGDVQLQHDDVGNSSTLQHFNTLGNFDIKSVTSINIKPGTTEGGSVSIYHDPDGSTETLRLQTTATGVDISGNLSVTGTVSGVDIEDLDNVNIAGGLQDQQVLKWSATNSAWEPANDLVGGAAGIQFDDLSIVSNAAGTAALSYNNSNGVFTYTPPDLSSYLTTETDPVFSAHVASGILQSNINQWTSAYNWGDHSTAGYLTAYSETDTLATVVARGNTAGGNINLGDNNKLIFGDGIDLEIFSDGSTSYIQETNASSALWIKSNSTEIRSNGNQPIAKFISNAGAELYYAFGDKKFETTATGVEVTGNLLYSNVYSALGDLPNATTYHGMFAHVHGEDHGYFAHAGAWTQLIDTGSNLSELADVATTAPSTSDVLTWDGSNWGPAAPTGGGGGANVTISDTAPGSASAGDLWWESDTGRLKIYYNDTDSIQWVDTNPPLSSPIIADPFTANGFKFGVNESSGPVSSTLGEIRQINGVPHFYDGSDWREFILGNTVTTTFPSETSWDKVLLRSTFDTDFNDVKYGAVGTANTYPSYGGVATPASTLVSTPSKYGTNVLKSVGNGVIYPHRSEYDFTSEFTMECWVYFDSLPATYTSSTAEKHIIFSKADDSFTTGSWQVYAKQRSNGQYGWYIDIHDGNTTTTQKQLSNHTTWDDFLNTWVHIALVKQSDGSLHFYVDGGDGIFTYSSILFGNDIVNSTHDLAIGVPQAGVTPVHQAINDIFIDDVRITKDARYTANGVFGTASFTPPATALPTSGSTTTFTPIPTSKAGVITLGASPSWRGSLGVTVTQQSSGSYRLTFTGAFTNADDYYVMVNHMDLASPVGVYVHTLRSTTHIDFTLYREGNGNSVDTGDLAVQVIAHTS